MGKSTGMSHEYQHLEQLQDECISLAKRLWAERYPLRRAWGDCVPDISGNAFVSLSASTHTPLVFSEALMQAVTFICSEIVSSWSCAQFGQGCSLMATSLNG